MTSSNPTPDAAAWQPPLFGGGAPSVDAPFARATRRELAGGAWVDHVPGWVTGADAVFEDLVENARWGERSQKMYDKEVVAPRLLASWKRADLPVAGPAIAEMRAALSDRYGVPFDQGGLNLYRHGRDSVAWHGDRILRTHDVGIVAIVTLGHTRRFLLRPKGGGTSVPYDPAHGDLLVMGGTAQRTWQHSVPKVAAAGPRISITFRWTSDSRLQELEY